MSEIKATCDPSGDQVGHLSCAPDECVRFRVGPFSIGALKISPRADTRTRSPLGLRLADSIKLAAETRLGRRAMPSSGTLMEMAELLRLLTLETWSSPFSS